MRVHSFPPISDPASRVLILGSMPGKASLRAKQYYAHPQNAFWRIITELLALEAAAPYEVRVGALRSHGIALWDVMKSCTRESSLDSDVVESSIVPNAFPSFFRAHPRIRTVCFNGAKAEASFFKYALPMQGGRRSRPTRSPQGREAAAQRGEAERSASPRETEASEGGPLHGPGALGDLAYYRLPSTSPAHASLSYAAKLAAWRAVLMAGSTRPTSRGATFGRGSRRHS